MTRIRRELPFSEWPADDRELWTKAFKDEGLFEQSGSACQWAVATATQVRHGYALWLGHLNLAGSLDAQCLPCDRVSRESLLGYIKDLQSRIAAVSVCSRLRDLSEALRVMQPAGNRELVVRALRNLERSARPSRNLRARLVAPSEIYEAGIRLMDRIALRKGRISTRTAVAYSDGLRIAMLIARPVRLRNLAGMRIGCNLIKGDSCYRLRFGRTETKTGETIDVDLPGRLTAYIDRWIEAYRPVFRGAERTDALWVSSHGGAMSKAGVYERICLTTKRELGVHINPHAFRHIVATSVAIAMPKDVEMTPFLLGHRTDRTVAEHYNLARSLSASARYLEQFERRRRQALDGRKAAI
jgi:integrase